MAGMQPPPRNALSVDVEDYFQVSAFEGHVAGARWEALPWRVEANTDRVLALLAEHGARATFFTLGWVAERFPALVRRIVGQGHELASHGWSHVRITRQSPEELRADAGRTKALLEDTGGCPVAGYRAASFSIGRDTLWAHEVLADLGYRYSSSIFPVRHDLYGMREAPRFPFACAGGRLTELPMSTVRVFGQNLPCAGGGYFRLLPYAYTRWALRRLNRHEGRAALFYFHPWELDPGQPRQRGLPARARLRHYTNLERMEPKLARLLGEFRWGRIDEVLLEAATRPELPEGAGRATLGLAAETPPPAGAGEGGGGA